jgi:hypothetical protein
MKGKDVKVGECYLAKVSGKPAKVRITGECPHGGWDAVNTATNRPVRIRGAGRLRKEHADASAARKQTSGKSGSLTCANNLPPAPATTPEVVQKADPAPTDATRANVSEPEADPAVNSEAELAKEAEDTKPVDILWMHPFSENTDLATHLVWPGCIGGSEVVRVVQTIPQIEGAGRARYVPMYRNGVGWISLEDDRHGHCRGHQSLAKAIDELESHHRTHTGMRALKTNAPEIVLAAQNQGIALIEEIEDMATKTKVTESTKATKSAKGSSRTKKAKTEGEMSCLDAAAKVLKAAKEPMNCQEMIKAMADKGYWNSPNGLTPHATLYSAILRELKTKGGEARFKKAERGKFAATESA